MSLPRVLQCYLHSWKWYSEETIHRFRKKYAHQLVTAYSQLVVSGMPKEFLRPGSTLQYIPGGRKARLKDAQHTVYRKALWITKDGFDKTTTKLLENGKACCKRWCFAN